MQSRSLDAPLEEVGLMVTHYGHQSRILSVRQLPSRGTGGELTDDDWDYWNIWIGWAIRSFDSARHELMFECNKHSVLVAAKEDWIAACYTGVAVHQHNGDSSGPPVINFHVKDKDTIYHNTDQHKRKREEESREEGTNPTRCGEQPDKLSRRQLSIPSNTDSPLTTCKTPRPSSTHNLHTPPEPPVVIDLLDEPDEYDGPTSNKSKEANATSVEPDDEAFEVYGFGNDSSVEDTTAPTVGPTGASADDPADLEDIKNSTLTMFTNTLNRCEQQDEAAWTEFSTFFKLPPSGAGSGRNPKEPIQMRQLQRHPFPYQLYAAFWMLRKERGDEMGGFVADEMGLGKTMEVILYCLLNIWIASNHEHVRSHPEAHLAPNSSSPDCDYAITNNLSFRCACVSAAFSARDMGARHGPTLLVVPPSLIPTWITEWSKTVPEEETATLVIGHRQSGTGPGIQAYRQRNVIGISEANAIKPLDPHQNDHNAITHNHYKATKFVVITTPRSYSTQVKEQGVSNARGTSPAWRALVRDEFHHDKSRNQTVRLFEDIAKRQSCAPSIWLLSGTPFERGPGDVTHWMNALVVETWESDQTLSLALPEKFKEMAGRVTSILNKNGKRSGQDDKFLESATSKFGSIMSRLMIRRVTESRWYNQPIVELPPNKHLDVCLSLNAIHIKGIQVLEQQALADAKGLYQKQFLNWRSSGCKGDAPVLRPQQFLQRAHQVRQLTVFPGLLDLMATHNVRLTEDEMNGNGTAIYNAIDINALARHSPKIKWLRHLLEKMQGSADCHNRPEKLIILSSFPITVQLVNKWLQARRYRTAVLTSKMTTIERQETIDSFNTDAPITTLDGDVRAPSPDIIISTFSLIGVGYTCVRAFRLVLMGPEWLHLEESQAVARIRRIGQRNPATYTYRLICQNVNIEQGMVDRQATRNEFNRMSMEIREDMEREHTRRLTIRESA